MNRDEVLEIARKAGFRIATYNSIDGPEVVDADGIIITDELERFAALVADRTQEECAVVADSFYSHIRMYTTDVPDIGGEIRSMKAY